MCWCPVVHSTPPPHFMYMNGLTTGKSVVKTQNGLDNRVMWQVYYTGCE